MNDKRFTFTQDGQYGALVYTMQPGEQISRFDDGMLMNNNISGVLSYSTESGVGGTKLSINILRGTQLSIIRRRALSGKYMVSVLLGIANVLVSAEQYMLREDHFVFDEDCIFVDVNSVNVNLVYIPTTGYMGISFPQFVKSFIANGSFETNEDMNYLVLILNFVNANPNAPADKMKAFLEQIQSNMVSPAQVVSQAAVMPNRPVQSVPAQAQRNVPPASSVPPVSSAPSAPPVSSVPPAPSVRPASSAPPAPEKANSAEKNGLFAKMFGGHKAKDESAASKETNNQKVPQPAGFMAGMNIPGMSAPAPTAPAQPSAPPKQAPEKKKPFQKEKPSAQNVTPPVVPNPVVSNPVTSDPGQFKLETEQIEQSPVTIVLSHNKGPGNIRRAYLIGTRGERIEISKKVFYIGKDNSTGIANDYLINNPAVSRNHAMFELTDGRYYVVDMSSSNGTFINGNQISSNVRFELKNGDAIILADEEFKFVIE